MLYIAPKRKKSREQSEFPLKDDHSHFIVVNIEEMIFAV